MLAALLHMISLSTPSVVAGLPIREDGRARAALPSEALLESRFAVRHCCHVGSHSCSGAVHVAEGAYALPPSPGPEPPGVCVCVRACACVCVF